MSKIKLTDIIGTPAEYRPAARKGKDRLPLRTVVMYALAYRVDHQYDIGAGPSSKLVFMLEQTPDLTLGRPSIWRFNLDGTTDILYRWKVDRWKLVKGE